jgi:hypothetical protein
VWALHLQSADPRSPGATPEPTPPRPRP